jgi:hypothetical protein
VTNPCGVNGTGQSLSMDWSSEVWTIYLQTTQHYLVSWRANNMLQKSGVLKTLAATVYNTTNTNDIF